jgi:hypothetical protein
MQPFNKEVQVNDWADLIEENFIRYFKHWVKPLRLLSIPFNIY